MTNEEIIEFLYNKENIRECDGCPYNEGQSDWQNRLPCGQWHCWVELHCDRLEEEE